MSLNLALAFGLPVIDFEEEEGSLGSGRILMENGTDFILLETGDFVLTE